MGPDDILLSSTADRRKRLYSPVLIGVAIALITAVTIFIANKGYQFEKFMSAGKRWTQEDAQLMQYRLQRVEIDHTLELRRLQIQIDALESVVYRNRDRPPLKPYAQNHPQTKHGSM